VTLCLTIVQCLILYIFLRVYTGYDAAANKELTEPMENHEDWVEAWDIHVSGTLPRMFIYVFALDSSFTNSLDVP